MAVAKQIVEDISEAKMKSKSRSSTILRFLSLMLVLMIAFLSFSVTDSPILATPGSIIDLRYSNVSIPSHISVLAFPILPKANSYFKQFSGEAVSYFSKLINDLGRIDDVYPIKFMNLTALEESSNMYHGYLKGSIGSEELDKKFEPIELEEDEESETEPDEGEFQMDVDLDNGGEVEIEGVDVLEIEEASAIQLAEVNEADSLEKDVEQGKHDLVETEKVSVVPAEGNESDSSERDLGQGLTTSNVEVELAESQSFIADNAVELMIDNPEILYVKRRSDKTLHPVAVSSKKFATHHVVKEKHSSQNWPTEVDVAGARRPSEMSIFQISSSHSKKYPKSEDDEAQRIEKKPRNSNRRESLAASEFSIGSPLYESFTTYVRIPAKYMSVFNMASGGEEVIIPIRRSSRIRSHANFSMKILKSRHCCIDN
ncbi:hypothetical protein FXO37_31892 [Capsicum annuum]|nr:hypothetical protein FXO37_31892 [Capsicum annuum]